MSEGDAVFCDPVIFRKHFKNIGRAYREQATTLIEICRLYVESSPQTYTTDDRLRTLFQLADAALSAAGRAKKGKTSEATDAFLHVQEEIKRFGPPSRKDGPGGHRKKLQVFDLSTALESASKKDEDSTRTLSKVKSAFKIPLPSGSTKKVNFVIRKSLHKDDENQSIIHQEIDNSTTITEIIWKFSRYPDENGQRITFRQNPHFYLRLSKDAPSFDSKFHKDPLTDFAHGLSQNSTIYVLLDKSCRLFLEAAKPHIPRKFGNLWKPHQTVILKDVSGNLDSEDTVLYKIGKNQDYWHRPSIPDSSQRRVQSHYSGSDSKIVNKPVGDGYALVDAALRSQNVDLMIRDRSMPEPPADSGWKLLPSSEPSIRIQEPEDQTTPRRSTAHLPQVVYSNQNVSAPSIGGTTLVTTSTASLETAVNRSDASLPTLAAGKRTQHIDSGIGLHLELPTTDTPSIPPSSAPPASLTIPSPLPGQDLELHSAPPVRNKGRETNWFRKYVYDYDP